LENNEHLLQFYTGIHEWRVFQSLYELVAHCLPSGPKLSSFSVFLMFSLKICLNLLNKDIAFHFNVCPSTVSRHFHKVLDVFFLHITAKSIKWSDRVTLRQTMPSTFRKFFKKKCGHNRLHWIFIERPSDLIARAKYF
jgi:hypothetical protein